MLKKSKMTEQEHCDAMWYWMKVFPLHLSYA